MSAGQQLNLSEYPEVVLDHGDGGMVRKLSAQSVGVERLTPANCQRKDLQAQRVLAGLVPQCLKFSFIHSH